LDAKKRIMEYFQFTEQQAEAIVTLQLYRLTNTDITSLKNEAEELRINIAKLEAGLKDEEKLLQTIKQDLLTIKEKYGTKRLTKIEDEIEDLEVHFEACSSVKIRRKSDTND